MHAGRILLDTYVPQAQQWCWRRDWHVKWESAWTLLWKFSYLNQVAGRDLASLIISRTCGKRSAILAKPQVDLRDGTVFDLAILSNLLRVEQSAVRNAFLYNVAPGSVLRSTEFLRWCEPCMTAGFHTPLFQISSTRVCPLHSQPLVDRCPRCQQKIPYTLTTGYGKEPFVCPHCVRKMMPTMEEDRPKILRLRPGEAALFGAALQQYQMDDVNIVNVDDARRLHKRVANFGITAARYYEWVTESGYLGFLAQVLRNEAPGVRITLSGTQFEKEKVVKHECGCCMPHETLDDDGMLEPGDLDSVGDSKQHPSEADVCLAGLFDTYKGIRRRLWRSLLKKHQRCIRSAAAHLAWNVTGGVTIKFCPYAMAYLRWRMFWEGSSTPRYLYAPPAKEMYGIIGWYLAHACMSPDHWFTTTKAWIARHLFAAAALDSFELMMRWARAGNAKAKLCWNHPISPLDYSSLWAVAGRDRHDRPAVVYVKRPVAERISLEPYSTSSDHWRSHQRQITQLTR